MTAKRIPRSRRRLCLWLAVFLSLFNIVAPFAVGKTSTPVIMISIDTLRPDHLSCYGSHRMRTANIDAIAVGGSVFTQISAQVPLTLPSHVSFLTSTYP